MIESPQSETASIALFATMERATEDRSRSGHCEAAPDSTGRSPVPEGGALTASTVTIAGERSGDSCQQKDEGDRGRRDMNEDVVGHELVR